MCHLIPQLSQFISDDNEDLPFSEVSIGSLAEMALEVGSTKRLMTFQKYPQNKIVLSSISYANEDNETVLFWGAKGSKLTVVFDPPIKSKRWETIKGYEGHKVVERKEFYKLINGE